MVQRLLGRASMMRLAVAAPIRQTCRLLRRHADGAVESHDLAVQAGVPGHLAHRRREVGEFADAPPQGDGLGEHRAQFGTMAASIGAPTMPGATIRRRVP